MPIINNTNKIAAPFPFDLRATAYGFIAAPGVKLAVVVKVLNPGALIVILYIPVWAFSVTIPELFVFSFVLFMVTVAFGIGLFLLSTILIVIENVVGVVAVPEVGDGADELAELFPDDGPIDIVGWIVGDEFVVPFAVIGVWLEPEDEVFCGGGVEEPLLDVGGVGDGGAVTGAAFMPKFAPAVEPFHMLPAPFGSSIADAELKVNAVVPLSPSTLKLILPTVWLPVVLLPLITQPMLTVLPLTPDSAQRLNTEPAALPDVTL